MKCVPKGRWKRAPGADHLTPLAFLEFNLRSDIFKRTAKEIWPPDHPLKEINNQHLHHQNSHEMELWLNQVEARDAIAPHSEILCSE